jgi:hypothetical protein
MGEKKLGLEIVTMDELIAAKYFDSEKEIYATPDSILPRVRRAGKIVRPLRFFWKDVEKLFTGPTKTFTPPVTTSKPTISFKKRRK